MPDSCEVHFKLADTKRLYKSIKRAKAVEKARRKYKTKARAQSEEEFIQSEGLLYGAGEF